MDSQDSRNGRLGSETVNGGDAKPPIDRARVQRLELLVAAVSQPLPGEAPDADSQKPRPEVKALYHRFHDELMSVTPQEVLDIFNRRLQAGLSAETILADLGKSLNLMFHGLRAYPWTRPAPESFAGVLMQENAALLSRFENIRSLLREGALDSDWELLGKRLLELEQFNDHYLKKENILFPYLERKADYFNGLAIMWALHDQVRALMRQTAALLKAGAPARADLTAAVGHLFFAMHGLVFKEELILLPAAMDTLTEAEWAEMERQEGEYGYPFITPPERRSAAAAAAAPMPGSAAAGAATGAAAGEALPPAPARFCTPTGELDFGQLAAVFDALPLDLTVVDENNKVRYFTRPKDRIFPRSPAIIGRDVRNCHPPESVGKVLEIVEAFRAGRKDSATFWIRMRGRLVLIRYFCLRDAEGAYRGTLEVSQDITDIQSLEGERRLAQWD